MPQVILAIHSMNVRTDLTAVIKIYVARIVLAKQPSTVSYVHTAMNTVRTLFARSIQHVLDRLMFCNGCEKIGKCSLLKSIYDAEHAHIKAHNAISESRSGLCVSEEEIARLNAIITPLVNNGQSVHQIYVAEYCGIVSGTAAAEILEKAKKQNPEAAMRILIKGDAEVSSEAAKVFADSGILLLGNESQTVGPEAAPMEVHLILLGAGIVLLEGIRLAEVPEGSYFLNAAPLNLSGADGSPCRAVLIAAER